jgi:hypothetical protein
MLEIKNNEVEVGADLRLLREVTDLGDYSLLVSVPFSLNPLFQRELRKS